MRIRIINSVANEVFVEAAIGAFSGIWQSTKTIPEDGSVIDVELDINVLWEEIRKNALESGATYHITMKEEDVVLHGQVDSLEDDMVYFRVSEDSLLMLEKECLSCIESKWFELCVNKASIGIVPVGY